VADLIGLSFLSPFIFRKVRQYRRTPIHEQNWWKMKGGK
jgi:hypothetical protein